MLTRVITEDDDPNVRAEAANALTNYGAVRAWPLLRSTFAADDAWLVRCSILSALAEQTEIDLMCLLELGSMAITDADSMVRVSGAEILARIIRDGLEQPIGSKPVTACDAQLDGDHRVVAAALNGLQN